MSLSTFPVQTFRFTDLPIELRLEVYEYALSGTWGVTLRSPRDLEIRKSSHGCRILTEVMPVFYDLNPFHYSILHTVPSVKGILSHFMLHLHLMQHVSIDYMLSTFAFNINKADRDVSTRVRSIVDGCPRLRTFTLHLLTFFENEDLSRGLSASSQTAFELSKLAARLQDRNFRLEWIAIVYHGDRLALKELRNGIAPMGNWVLGMGMEWPDISIDERQKEGIRSHESGDPTQSIRTYRLCSGTCLESRRACWADGMRVSS